MSDFWSDPDLHAGGEYFKFEKDGDTIAGTILHMSKKVFDDGSVAPQLLIQLGDGTETTVTCGQIRLKVKLNELRPTVGDSIQITQTQSERRAGGKTLKHFEVNHRQGNGAPPQQVGGQQAQQAFQQQQAYPPTQFQQPAQQHYPQATDQQQGLNFGAPPFTQQQTAPQQQQAAPFPTTVQPQQQQAPLFQPPAPQQQVQQPGPFQQQQQQPPVDNSTPPW